MIDPTMTVLKTLIAQLLFASDNLLTAREIATKLELEPKKTKHYDALRVMTEQNTVERVQSPVGYMFTITDYGISQYGLNKRSALAQTENKATDKVEAQKCKCEPLSNNPDHVWCKGQDNCRFADENFTYDSDKMKKAVESPVRHIPTDKELITGHPLPEIEDFESRFVLIEDTDSYIDNQSMIRDVLSNAATEINSKLITPKPVVAIEDAEIKVKQLRELSVHLSLENSLLLNSVANYLECAFNG